jgi:hypothetical protein
MGDRYRWTLSAGDQIVRQSWHSYPTQVQAEAAANAALRRIGTLTDAKRAKRIRETARETEPSNDPKEFGRAVDVVAKDIMTLPGPPKE